MESTDLVGGTGGMDSGAAERLRADFLALRLSTQKWGARKTLSSEQRGQAGAVFGADGDVISAGKKLIDTKHEAYRAVTSCLSNAREYWERSSLPYPERGIRLIRADQMEVIVDQLQEHKRVLANCVFELDSVYADLKADRARALGELFNEADYPARLVGAFSIDWDFPSVEPPEYLRSLNPRVWQEQCRRVEARFSEAVALAEAAFTEELASLVDHLADKLSGADDRGKKKIFRDSAVENFNEFFARFRSLNIGSSEELENLVERAEGLLGGVDPSALRSSDDLRARVASQLVAVQSSLDGLLVDRPRRKITREGE